MTNRVIPRPEIVLIERVAPPDKQGSLYLPAGTAGPVLRGRVIGLSPLAFAQLPPDRHPFALNDVVLYTAHGQSIVDLDAHQSLVPISLILAREDRFGVPELDPNRPQAFFHLPAWSDFEKTLPSRDQWVQWENFSEVSVDIGFMEPFSPLDALRRTMYEECCRSLNPHLRDNLMPFEYSIKSLSREIEDGGRNTDEAAVVDVRDDLFDGRLFLTRSRLGFRKARTTLRTLVETVPVWMKALHAILCTPAFLDVAGTNYDRVLFLEIALKQVIRLEGVGLSLDPITNAELMAHFLQLGVEEDTNPSPTLSKLGLEKPVLDSLGRVDLKLSFRRKIGSAAQPFLVWFNAQAPTNESKSTIHVSWDIQDYRPTGLDQRQYGPVIEEFLGRTVLGQFYRAWFKNVKCTSIF